jgi:uncharacterized cupredoxin-like copper-binding protein
VTDATRRPRAAATLLVALVLAAGLAACSPAAAATHVEITIRYSRFLPASFEVPRGVPVTIVLRNDDPIDHEWIVGEADVHARHRTGTEPVHDQVATEVTVPAHGTRTTTITFERAGAYVFVCHLPRHEAYGMVGRLVVRG